MEEAHSIIPHVVESISSAVEVHSLLLLRSESQKQTAVAAKNVTLFVFLFCFVGTIEIDRRGGGGAGGAGGAADRVLSGVPAAVPQVGGQIRPTERVPQALQHALVGAQFDAPAGRREAPEQAPGREDHLRRLLHPGHPIRAATAEIR